MSDHSLNYAFTCVDAWIGTRSLLEAECRRRGPGTRSQERDPLSQPLRKERGRINVAAQGLGESFLLSVELNEALLL